MYTYSVLQVIGRKKICLLYFALIRSLRMLMLLGTPTHFNIPIRNPHAHVTAWNFIYSHQGNGLQLQNKHTCQ